MNRAHITLDGHDLGGLERGVEVGDEVVSRLTALLKRKRDLWQSFHPHQSSSGEVLLEVDRELPFGVVRRLAEACAQAGYPRLGFVGVQLPR